MIILVNITIALYFVLPLIFISDCGAVMAKKLNSFQLAYGNVDDGL